MTVDLRPLTARSVIVSTLLGTHPPVLPPRVLVAAAGLFGVSESAARTALSRLVAAGQLAVDDGRYALVGDLLLGRQQRQDVGRSADRRPWNGDWLTVIIAPGARPAADRARQRTELQRARLAELRDGVWIRPDNLPPRVSLVPDGVDAIVGRLDPVAGMPSATVLWDLDGWSAEAGALLTECDALKPGLEAGDESLLARGFVVAAAVLRLFQRDPLLPDELLDPSWPGVELRSRYDRFDAAYRALLRSWFAAAPT